MRGPSDWVGYVRPAGSDAARSHHIPSSLLMLMPETFHSKNIKSRNKQKKINLRTRKAKIFLILRSLKLGEF